MFLSIYVNFNVVLIFTHHNSKVMVGMLTWNVFNRVFKPASVKTKTIKLVFAASQLYVHTA